MQRERGELSLLMKKLETTAFNNWVTTICSIGEEAVQCTFWVCEIQLELNVAQLERCHGGKRTRALCLTLIKLNTIFSGRELHKWVGETN